MTKEELEMAMEEIKACTANAKDIRNITVSDLGSVIECSVSCTDTNNKPINLNRVVYDRREHHWRIS